MANDRKRRKLEELDLPDYIKKINAGEMDGTFDAQTDLLNAHYANDELLLKYRQRDDFEFHALLLDGMTTGYARCTLEKCKERMKNGPEKAVVFMVNQQNRSGMQHRFMKRHLVNYHKNDEEIEQAAQQRREARREAQQARREASQPLITAFAQRSSKLGSDVVTELKSLNAAVIATQNLSMDFFVSEEMIERDRYLLKAAGVDPMEAHRFDRGAVAVKNDLFQTGSANWRLIKSVAPQIAQKSRFGLLIDHQKVLNLSNEPHDDALGVALILSATDGKRYTYVLAFENVESTRNQHTVTLVNQIAKD